MHKMGVNNRVMDAADGISFFKVITELSHFYLTWVFCFFLFCWE